MRTGKYIRRMGKIWWIVWLVLLASAGLVGQRKGAHYDERRVPDYELPNPLRSQAGEAVSATEWPARRQELVRLFEQTMYGRVPGELDSMQVEMIEEGMALNGRARRRQYRLHFFSGDRRHAADLLLYLPAGAESAVPVVVGMNFFGNHTILDDPAIRLPTSWLPNREAFHITDNRATEASRGVRAYRWPVEYILDRGYGLAAIYAGDFDPDRPDHWQDGVHPLFYKEGQQRPAGGEWATLAAWAWGYWRVVDRLVDDPAIDAERIILMGHSRLGKAALWAGANDERVALTISNDSGAGGAALSRRGYGETVKIITESFPHWFVPRFADYAGREAELPIDQHQLLALVAPRLLYVASAHDDGWADPRGEYLSAYHAGRVYEFLGQRALFSPEPPPTDVPLHDAATGYHRRSGGHDVTDYDWRQFLDYADRHLVRD